MSKTDALERPDPRPRLEGQGETARVIGVRCSACRYPSADSLPRCPICRSDVEAAEFSAQGVVWSSTVVRVPVPGRTPPVGLAYVDLDDGPRVITHVRTTDAAIPVGTRVLVDGTTDAGDIIARELP